MTPSAENRGLRVVADSGEFFRSSYLPLDGADAAPVTDTSFKNLPGGEYEVSVTLVDSQGHATHRRSADHHGHHCRAIGIRVPTVTAEIRP